MYENGNRRNHRCYTTAEQLWSNIKERVDHIGLVLKCASGLRLKNYDSGLEIRLRLKCLSVLIRVFQRVHSLNPEFVTKYMRVTLKNWLWFENGRRKESMKDKIVKWIVIFILERTPTSTMTFPNQNSVYFLRRWQGKYSPIIEINRHRKVRERIQKLSHTLMTQLRRCQDGKETALMLQDR